MAELLKEYSNFPLDIGKVLLMLLIHDIVEIDAGDTFFYAQERALAGSREAVAARRIFDLLPKNQAKLLFDTWLEFEERKTSEAKFATVFDRLEPVLRNYKTEGYGWKKYGITKSVILEKNKHIYCVAGDLRWRSHVSERKNESRKKSGIGVATFTSFLTPSSGCDVHIGRGEKISFL